MAENQNAADQASTLNDERATRLAKRAALFEAGQNPYPEHSELEDYVADIEAKYAELADGEDTEDVVKIAGRVVAKRGQGKIMFIVVRDATAEIQLFCLICCIVFVCLTIKICYDLCILCLKDEECYCVYCNCDSNK